MVQDGITFDSRKEAKRWLDLVSEQKQGLIQNLRRQVRIPLILKGQRVFTYIADYTYVKNGVRVVEDCKSSFTRMMAVYRLKKKILKVQLNLEIVEV